MPISSVTLRTRPRRLLGATLLVVLGLTGQSAAWAEPETASAPAAVAMSNTASASGYPAGVAIYDSVNLGYGVNPTGRVTFSLFGPDNATCAGVAIFTSAKPVNGNGYYQSDSYVTSRAGTYRWTAVYGGDANNSPAATPCSDPNAVTEVGRRIPSLNSRASSLLADGTIVDKGVLSNGAGPSGPTGTLTFTLFGPNNMVCGGPPIFTSKRTVTGNGEYVSDGFRPTQPGTYQWGSMYGGDANNFSQQTLCSDPAQAVTVTSVTSVTSTNADFNGNGSTDYSVFRPSNGTWYLRDGTTSATAWGVSGDIPVPGDYDGDGSADLAVFRPRTGEWFVRESTWGYPAWGVAGDIPVPGDYDGNGTTDIAVYRPSTGQWFVRNSTQGYPAWGIQGDIPAPGDYDGNGSTDIVAYRPSTGQWFIWNSQTVLAWGTPGDLPLPLPAALRQLIS